jgi:hypothetical protein
MAARIIIRRRTRRYGAWRNLNILIDGQIVGSVRHEGTFEREVAPGPHQVAVKMDWVRSESLDVQCEEGTPVVVLVETPGSVISLMFLTYLKPSRVFRLRLQPPISS